MASPTYHIKYISLSHGDFFWWSSDQEDTGDRNVATHTAGDVWGRRSAKPWRFPHEDVESPEGVYIYT